PAAPAQQLPVVDVAPLQPLGIDALRALDRRIVKDVRLRPSLQQRRVVLPAVTQPLVDQRRDRRQHADRPPPRLTTTLHTTDATYLTEHSQQLARLDQLIEHRREAFRAKTGREMSDDNVWLAQRRQERRALQKIITILAQPELSADSGQAIRGAGVAARTEP